MKCKVCGNEFEALKENKYIVKDNSILTGKEQLYDCFDCPKCGCQVIGKVRMEMAGGVNEQSINFGMGNRV